ncbi:hypothetical protein IQ230_15645 [Gloeocapsopsis crepidinum LEGE 06123]|uniref:Uncharacterized protein n=1 Tax=Gloeocapsopsis crepidinum LEGE 06123 TaxID=588587 RepID=A0ABR9UTZ7_9CHRO|nr:hypothetical protein [Gloeocapsopsis crepidinum]MBE9191756.1 hypothetical protein [Gloeocapsopsis crepidinum LEGE 06123]
MEKLLELRELLQQGKVEEALLLVDKLEDMNRRTAGGCYLSPTQLSNILQEGYQMVLKRVSAEAFEGRFEAEELESIVDRQAILSQAIALI